MAKRTRLASPYPYGTVTRAAEILNQGGEATALSTISEVATGRRDARLYPVILKALTRASRIIDRERGAR